MPRGSLVFAHETSPSAFPAPKAWLPALELPGLHFFPPAAKERCRPSSKLSIPERSQAEVMGKAGFKGSRFQRDVRQWLLPTPFHVPAGRSGGPAAQLSPGAEGEGRKELPPSEGTETAAGFGQGR